MDLRMPGVGRRRRRSASSRERGTAARVLVLTTYDTDADVCPRSRPARPATCSRTRRATSCPRGPGGGSGASRCSRRRWPRGWSARSGRRPGGRRCSERELEVLRAGRPGRDQPRGGGPAVHQRGDGEDPPAPHLRQAGRRRPGGGGGDGVRARAAGAPIGADPLARPPYRGRRPLRCEAAWYGGRPMFVSMVRRCSIPPLPAVAALAIVALAACGGAGTESAGARSASTPGVVASGGAIGSTVVAGDDLCKLLGPGDLTAAGRQRRRRTDGEQPATGRVVLRLSRRVERHGRDRARRLPVGLRDGCPRRLPRPVRRVPRGQRQDGLDRRRRRGADVAADVRREHRSGADRRAQGPADDRPRGRHGLRGRGEDRRARSGSWPCSSSRGRGRSGTERARDWCDCRPGTPCAILPLRPEPGRRVPAPVVRNRYHEGEQTISRDLRVNQMIRIPQVRVVDEEGAQLGVMPTPQALEMAQERGLDLVEVAPMAAPPVVKFLDFGQYKYELTKREKEAKRKQRSVTFKEVRLSPKIGVGGLRHQGPSRDRVPRGRRPDQGDGPLPRSGADPSGARSEPPREVRRSGQGARRRGADAAPRGQVDAHHDGIAAQAEGARRSRTRGPPTEDGKTATRPTRPRPNRQQRHPASGSSTASPATEAREASAGARGAGPGGTRSRLRPRRRPRQPVAATSERSEERPARARRPRSR